MYMRQKIEREETKFRDILCVADFILLGQFVIHWENFGVEPDDYHLEKTIT